jgi:hypothetical protein
MLWPAEYTKVFSVSIEDSYISQFIDRAEREKRKGAVECEVEAVLARRAIPGDHCFYTGEAVTTEMNARPSSSLHRRAK